MKILFFLINMNLGGTEKSCLNLLENLPPETKVDLLLLENYGQLMNAIPPSVNVKIIEHSDVIQEYARLGSRRWAIHQFKKRNYRWAGRAILQFLAEKAGVMKSPYWAIYPFVKPVAQKYDIAVAYAGVHNFIAWYILSKVKAKKKVLWIHFDVEKVIKDFRFGKTWYSQFNQIFCVSENATKIFQKNFPNASHQTITFNNIISPSLIQNQAQKGKTYDDDFNGVRILTLGRLSKEKGQQMIPAVVKKLKTDGFDFKWYLIGDGSLRKEIENDIKKFGIENELILLGRQINPYHYLKDCDLFVLTSFYEGDPVAVKEAKAFDKPIVATNFTTVQDLINNEENGLIVDISEEGLYQGVKRILSVPELFQKLAKPALESTHPQKMIEKLLTL